ncbi:MAG: exodeoxyribonuclease V subunit gamma [Proteobacteria bacterium]|nr:exodeoxyribonuclease V subunit gamma [Pseudomonadota bacterium]MBU1717219.1 exodeoxyribonuclease V subunit gamma [Pseudomonadota bacterium]
MSFNLYTSNRLEVIAEQLAQVMISRPLPVFSPEIVVVQSGGMARWLSMRLAESNGICANIEYPFPNGLLRTICCLLLPDCVDFGHDKRIMAWQIMGLLPRLLERTGFEPLKAYLADGRALKRFQLAGQIADLFDQYSIFRPEMVLAWQEKGGVDWQPLLWQELCRAGYLAERPHRAELLKELLGKLAASSLASEVLPARISIFGISSIPNYHLQVFAALGQHTEVNFFLMNPCQVYWDDIVGKRQIDRIVRDSVIDQDSLYLTEGNPLLASMGNQGRDLFRMIHEFDCVEYEFFQEPTADPPGGGRNILTMVQDDILNLADGAEQETLVLPVDRSIRVSSCHSAMREVEVLYDQLLAMFEEEPDLEPREIMVMTSDIELYGPLVQAVFGREGDDLVIPYSIADRALTSEGQLVREFMMLLELTRGRYGVTEVLGVIRNKAVAGKFKLDDHDFMLIEKWVSDVHIRWGIDGEDRRRLGLPATAGNSWRAGLDRMLLGYAMAGSGRTFQGILPYDEMEGRSTETLGRFIHGLTTIFEYLTSLAAGRTLAGWSEDLLAIFNDCFSPDDESQGEAQLIRNVLLELAADQLQAPFPEAVEFEVVFSHLRKLLGQEVVSAGFMTGSVTFCQMLPMRAIPFKIICLLGMNDNVFPRADRRMSFDLLAADFRPGDRSMRQDDRYLFLEAILSARRRLYLSYVGQSIRDGSQLPPSVLVTELLDYLDQRFEVEGRQLSELLVTRHPLQPFSQSYFTADDPELFSYSRENLMAAKVGSRQVVPEVLVAHLLPEPEPEYRNLDLEQLISFFVHPARYLCNHRLGIYLDREQSWQEESEPFKLEGLTRYHLETELLTRYLAGSELEEFLPAARSWGLLPHGRVGEAAYRQTASQVRELGRLVKGVQVGEKSGPLELELGLAGFKIVGRLENIWGARQVYFRCGKIKARDQVRIWLRHLFLNAATGEDSSFSSLLIGKDLTMQFEPQPEAGKLLADLLAIYWLGLRTLLPFCPATSLAYAETLEAKGEDFALAKAGEAWLGSGYQAGEVDDPYYHLCYRGESPLTADFVALAVEFFGPLLAGRQRGER